MSDEKQKGGRNKMATTKPIRPTELEFKSETEKQRFVNYANAPNKTDNEALNRMRELLKNHHPAKEKK
jgi:hypothetical protein